MWKSDVSNHLHLLRKYNQVGEARHLNVMIETKYKRKDILVGEREKERNGREGRGNCPICLCEMLNTYDLDGMDRT